MIVLDHITIEQICEFKYLHSLISPVDEIDSDNKKQNITRRSGIIERYFCKSVQKYISNI
jgi:hypothetical protein